MFVPLQWYGHVSHSPGLAKTTLQGTVKGGRRQGGQRKRWEDNIREWTGLEFTKSQKAVENMKKWRKWLQNHLWCPNNPHGQGIGDDDDDDTFYMHFITPAHKYQLSLKIPVFFFFSRCLQQCKLRARMYCLCKLPVVDHSLGTSKR